MVRRPVHGFSLTELLIALAIVGILGTVALPSYRDSVRKSNRSDAKVVLTEIAQRLERCFSQFGAYNDANCVVVSPQTSPQRFYTITADRTATTFTLTATPAGTQADDASKCATFSLDHRGTKTATGSRAPECW